MSCYLLLTKYLYPFHPLLGKVEQNPPLGKVEQKALRLGFGCVSLYRFAPLFQKWMIKID
jgi:hypothetical protein